MLNKYAANWLANSYNKTIDSISNWFMPMFNKKPQYAQGQLYTSEDPSKPITNATPLHRNDPNKVIRNATLGDRRDWRHTAGVRDLSNNNEQRSTIAVNKTLTHTARQINSKYNGTATAGDIAHYNTINNPNKVKKNTQVAFPISAYVPSKATRKQLFYAPYGDFFDAADSYKEFKNRNTYKTTKGAKGRVSFIPSTVDTNSFSSEEFDNIMSENVNIDASRPKRGEEARAYYDSDKRLIRLFPQDGPYVVYHEFGHGVTHPFINGHDSPINNADGVDDLRWRNNYTPPMGYKNVASLSKKDINGFIGSGDLQSRFLKGVYGKNYADMFTYYQAPQEAATTLLNARANIPGTVTNAQFKSDLNEIVTQLQTYRNKLKEIGNSDPALYASIKRDHDRLQQMYKNIARSVGY